MSTETNISRQPAGAPASTGGRFAPTQLDDNGTVLTAAPAVPEWGVERRAELEANLGAANTALDFARQDETILQEQQAAAERVQREAFTAAPARAAGADVGELEFMRGTARMARELACDDVDLALARLDVDRDSAAAIKECTSLRSREALDQSVILIHALDLETDMGAGHIGWHPWHSEARADTIREIEDYLEAAPTGDEASLRTEILAQLRDPFRAQRVALEVRRSPTEANLAQRTLTQLAEQANAGIINDQARANNPA